MESGIESPFGAGCCQNSEVPGTAQETFYASILAQNSSEWMMNGVAFRCSIPGYWNFAAAADGLANQNLAG